MFNQIKYYSLFVFCILSMHCTAFDRVIIWGHKPHTHTHSYIHDGFYRGFKYLGYPTYWVSHLDDLKGIKLSNSLFLTEGQVCSNMPLRKDCDYILHNVDNAVVEGKIDEKRTLIIQVFTTDVLQREVKELAPYHFFSLKERLLYLPWATDLLPHEINRNKEKLKKVRKNQSIVWVGTIWKGPFSNYDEIYQFVREVKRLKPSVYFDKDRRGISRFMNSSLVMKSLFAPAIVGTWQKEKGYIPCRIFKNISYGAMPITNSYHVWKLFEEKILYHADTKELARQAVNALRTHTIEKQYAMMDFVRDHHTYLNRIQVILDCLKEVKQSDYQ